MKKILWVLYGVLSAFISHFIINLFNYNLNFELTFQQSFITRPEIYWIGTLIFYIIYVFLTSITGHPILGSIFLISSTILVGTTSYLKMIQRGEPLYPNEIYWLKELPFLFKMIGKKYTLIILLTIILTVILFLVLKKVISNNLNETFKNKYYRMSIFVISFFLLIYISRFNYSGNLIKKVYNDHAYWMAWNQQRNYDANGFLAGFLYNLDALPMEKPENYSKAKIEEISNKYIDISKKINENKGMNTETNIIFVMNESFSDPLALNGINSNEDPLMLFRENLDNTLHGSVIVPGYGGGTATNEFEVLTGISLEPLAPHINSPFIQLASRMERLPSFVKKMNHLGYKSTAIHPYSEAFYRRRDVYEYLGFEDFIYEEKMTFNEKASPIHSYISDEATYNEVFKVIKDTPNSDFIHVVTMQNHTEYKNQFESSYFEVSGTKDEESGAGYFKGLSISDQALDTFLTKIDQYPEPILLVFWGDHLPDLYDSEVFLKNPAISKYETPFFIYSNDKALKGKEGMKSLVYLSNYIFKTLNIKTTPFEALLKLLEDNISVFDDRFYIEPDSIIEKTSRNELDKKTQEILEEYSLIVYDVTTGENFSTEMGMFDIINE